MGTGSGNRQMVINTRERAVSSDINRLQQFGARTLAEVLRRLMNAAEVTDFVEAGSFVDTAGEDAAAIATPLKADVYEGLYGLPQAASLSVLVAPGAVGVDDPDGQTGSSDSTSASADDSRYKIVIDPGINVVGALVFAAGSGGTRVDVLECRRQVVVLQTDNRDVFDPLTNTFVPTTVNKVVESRLQYRVRAGTPGAGYPGNVQGWLPLMVAVVPSSATSCDDMTFYDVRPLVKDRVNAPHEQISLYGTGGGDYCDLTADDSGATTTFISGAVMARLGRYVVGGQFSGTFDAQSSDNQASGYSAVDGRPWYLYLVTPFSLPRWVKYSIGAPYLPVGLRGIPVVSAVGPSSYVNAGTTINLPAASGLGSSGSGVCIAAGFIEGGVECGFFVDGKKTIFSALGIAAAAANTTAAANVLGAVTDPDQYNLTANTDFPKNARTLRLEFVTRVNTSGPGEAFMVQPVVYVSNSGRTHGYAQMNLDYAYFYTDASNHRFVKVVVDVPWQYVPDGAALHIDILWGISGSTLASRDLRTLTRAGWQLF